MRLLPLAFLTLAACADLSDEVAPERTAARDSGGSVALRALEIASLEARGQEKRIAGECLSACTMYLGLSTACFEPDAVLGFHGPRLAMGIPMSDSDFDALSRTMASYYPPRIARRFMEDWRYRERTNRIPAQRLIARGEARACD